MDRWFRLPHLHIAGHWFNFRANPIVVGFLKKFKVTSVRRGQTLAFLPSYNLRLGIGGQSVPSGKGLGGGYEIQGGVEGDNVGNPEGLVAEFGLMTPTFLT